MSTISSEMRRLNNINKAYQNTSGEIKEMWRKKWYALVKLIAGRMNESKRLTTNTG